MRCILLPLILVGLLTCCAGAALCPQGDLDGDCKVSLGDIAVFAAQWLSEGGCSDSACPDFDHINGINLADFALLARNWRQTGIRLVINELMASNTSESGITDPQGDYDDWLEIYNFGDVNIDLAGMYLTDDLDDPDKWRIPTGYPSQTTVPADGFIVFWADEETQDGPLHAGFKLSGSGEDIALFNTNGVTLIDAISFGDQTANISYGRFPDANDTLRFFATPTPVADNNGAYLGSVEAPDFSRDRGFYTADFNVTIACVTPGASIYYTIDGNDPIKGESPSLGSIAYTAPLHITTTKCLRAAAIKTGWMPSNTKTHTYIFNATNPVKSLPVYSLVGDRYHTFYEPNGIMAIVGGYYDETGAWQSSGPDSYNNPMQRGMAYERTLSFEILDWFDVLNNYQVDCGIRVRGSDYSRPRYTRGDDWTCWTSNKFSFNLYFRSIYGESRLEYDIFPDTIIDGYRSVALRGGRNDQCNPFTRDEWVRRLHTDMGAAEATGGFSNLFINGQYKGYFNPCGRIDREFLQDWYNSDNNFDVITQSGVRDGNSTAWNALVNYAKTHDLSVNSYYQQVANKLDIQAYIDYLILEIYVGNWDWPANNWTVAREVSDLGRFRFSIWDAEGVADAWAMGNNFEKTAFNYFPSWWTWSPAGLNNIDDGSICTLYRALKPNADFRQLFADRIHRHFHNGGVLSKDHLAQRFWELAAEVSGIIPNTDRTIPDSFIPQREDKVMFAFDANGLFDRDFNAPVFNINGAYKHGGYISAGDLLSITNPNPSGATYYTLDGNDTRLSGGIEIVYLVTENASKKVLVPTYNIGTTWRGGNEPYNDSAWTSGTGGVGYEMDTGYETFINIDVEQQMYNHNASCCIRIPFTIDACDLNSIKNLAIRVRYDDGFVAYLNGTGVRGQNNWGPPAWDSNASALHEASADFEEFDISPYISNLKAGNNILAIQGLNYSKTSSDFLVCAELINKKPIFGGVSPAAIRYTAPVALNNSVLVKARILSDTNEWSALNEAVYAVGDAVNNLRITEVMYHPADANTEYVELKNIGASAINLNLVKFTKGIDFTFGPNTLSAGQSILVVENRTAFEAKYGAGRYIAGEYSGSLDNGGERIRLEDALGGTILDFDYKDGWRPITDGDGYSLTTINPANPDPNSWSKKDSWRSSAYIDGSPGWNDSGIIPNPGSIVINEVMSHSHANAPDWIELYNTTGSSINIAGWFLSDSDSNIMKYEFKSGTTIGPYGYLVVYEDVNFGLDANYDPGRRIPFALSENGDMVCLSSGLDANGLLTGYRTTEDFGASATGVSFGRYYKASTSSYNFVPMDHNTPRAANAYPKVGPIIITEIMYHPDWPATGSYSNDEYEYIELNNITASPVTLYDSSVNLPWKFTDGIDYTFPSPPNAVTIPAGGRILVVKNPTAFSQRYPSVPLNKIFGPYTGWLANDGEQLQLGQPGDIDEFGTRQYIRVERIDYSDGSHPGGEPGDVDLWPTLPDGSGKSLTRISNTAYANDPNNWTSANPSPGT